MATVADFRALLPQFAAVDDATIQAWLDAAAQTVDSSWGDQADYAQIMLAAHLMSLAGIGPEKAASAKAAVTSVRSGSLSFTLKSKSEYERTSFGALFYPIFRSIHGGIFVTGTGDYPWPYGGQADA